MDTSILGQVEHFVPDEPIHETRDSTRPSAALEKGACLQGKYIVRGVLGLGGFAVVYDAEHLGLGRRVAIKVLHVGMHTPLALVERFHREARISALVRHPNVLEVYDTGQLPDGSPFLVMERVNGENLSSLLKKGPLSIPAAIELSRQLLLGLAAIADAGIVHRDIKPDNIMLHDAGDGALRVKLVDFGISKHVSVEPHARLTCDGALVGTPQYMSPEQIRGEEVDVRSDLYAAGAVLYEALAGQAPHACDNFSELVVAVLNNQVRPLPELRPNCPPELWRIIAKALSRARKDRYPSPRALLAALDDFAEAFELPQGAEAFDAGDDRGSLPAPVRHSLPCLPQLWVDGCRDLKMPLRAAAVIGLLLTPRWLWGEETRAEAPRVAEVAPAVTHVAPAPPAALSVFNVLPSAVAHASPLAPELERIDREPEPATVALTSTAPVAMTSSAPPVARRRRVEAPALRATPASVAVAATASRVEAAHPATPQLDASRRARWQGTMQQALSALVRGELKAARDSYAEAVRVEPREAAGFRGLGLVAARLGDRDGARRALEQYLALSPHADDAATIAARLSALH